MSETNPKQPESTPPPDDHEEFVHEDDTVIGHALKWSAIAAVFLVVAGFVAYTVLKPKDEVVQAVNTEVVAPEQREVPAEESVPESKFTDITAAAGIDFSHNNGAIGDKLLPESMGNGVAFFDFDADGDQDLLFTNGTWWPWDLEKKPELKPTTAALYRNDGKGTFEDVTAGSGLDVPFYGMGAAIGDLDNDGLPDVYQTAVGGNRLFRNLGNGKFADVTAEAGVGGGEKEWSTSAAFADIDNDGDLDLFVCNYVRWSREIDFEVNYTLVGVGRAYGPPTNFEGTFPSLFRNDGNGKFTDISATAGVQIRSSATKVPMAKSLGVSPVDLDGDGWVDFIVANDTVHNFVFKNKKDGTFTEMGGISGIGFDNNGKVRGAMGIDVARFRNDDSLGIGIGNFANEMTALYVSTPNNQLLFTDNAITEGVGPDSRLLLKFGLFFFDYDLDGWLDLLTANGHLEEEITKVQKSQSYAQPAQLFWNCGGTPAMGGFATVDSTKAGADLFKPIVGRGSAYADIDGDGDLDVAFTQLHGKPLLLRNDQALGNHWLRVKLTGKAANRDGVGAMLKLKSGETTQWRLVTAARSYLSQSETVATFGLGQEAKQAELTVVWPGGEEQTVAVPKLDTTLVIEQP
ncbi:MAG TPA: CRTAC1 family protein [Verrucomicrobiales bacterium]|jgi:hypothetical protein|nr:CRTAC1 family protein [Pedosphaera sp.]HAL04222.1 CRTAC1 family protein [Verrucomicrobiales bacterium]HBV32793.1 CRTAC1 family protein [Verrucomicrobiales bacterium]|tara:strand:- start:636 stop:2525 length:1890 start_codon:yes stop_codon:yes gene_type:complete